MMGEYFISKKGLVDDFVKGFATCEELVVLLASSCRINPYIVIASAELAAGLCNYISVFKHRCFLERFAQISVFVFFSMFVH